MCKVNRELSNFSHLSCLKWCCSTQSASKYVIKNLVHCHHLYFFCIVTAVLLCGGHFFPSASYLNNEFIALLSQLCWLFMMQTQILPWALYLDLNHIPVGMLDWVSLPIPTPTLAMNGTFHLFGVPTVLNFLIVGRYYSAASRRGGSGSGLQFYQCGGVSWTGRKWTAAGEWHLRWYVLIHKEHNIMEGPG